jgi:hypothetical protein
MREEQHLLNVTVDDLLEAKELAATFTLEDTKRVGIFASVPSGAILTHLAVNAASAQAAFAGSQLPHRYHTED